jgi:hypothetical protein
VRLGILKILSKLSFQQIFLTTTNTLRTLFLSQNIAETQKLRGLPPTFLKTEYKQSRQQDIKNQTEKRGMKMQVKIKNQTRNTETGSIENLHTVGKTVSVCYSTQHAEPWFFGFTICEGENLTQNGFYSAKNHTGKIIKQQKNGYAIVKIIE